ncbi:7460_t:CDS:1, partial [Paraglomus occultum]
MVQVDSSSTAIGLLFNAAKVLAEQQTNMEIESVHFMDGWVHLNMRDMMIGDVETAEEENTTLQNLAQHADIGDQTHYGHQTLDLDCGRYMGENNDYTDCDPVLTLQQTSHDQMQTIDQVSNYDIGDLYANKEINEAEIRVEINYVRPPSPITSSLQSLGASSSHYEYQSSSMIAG